MSSSIESSFPIEQVNRLAKVESYRKNIYRPPYHIHKWWAKRLGSVFRAIVLGALLPENDDPWAHFYQGYDFKGKIVLDPFMGAGTTLGEALRLGCKVIGQDINPVAWFQVKKALEDVNLGQLDQAFAYLEQFVAPDITCYYKTRCPEPECNARADVLYGFWVKVLPCPKCDSKVDLFTSRIFSKAVRTARDPRGYATCPECGAVNELLDVREKEATCPICGHIYDPHKGPATRSTFTCPFCQSTHRIVEVVRQVGQVPDHRLYAIDCNCPQHGRQYKAPLQEDIDLYNEASQQLLKEDHLIPSTPIPDGYNTRQILNFNYAYWRDCFNGRQLYCISTLLKGIMQLPSQIADNNAKEFLVLLLSACLEFNNMFCSFKGRGTGAVRHMFSHHILCPEKTPLENNLWGTPDSSGSFSTLYHSKLRKAKEWCLHPVERLVSSSGKKKLVQPPLDHPVRARFASSWDDLTKKGADALIRCASSTELVDIPDKEIDAVITDPPYFDNVNYSELADFFYAWLRLALRDKYAEFQEENTRREEEAIVNPAQGKTPEFYQVVLTRVFREAHRVLKDQGCLVFTFHHGNCDAWASVYRAINDAGFYCAAAWPIQGEMSVAVPLLGKKNAIEHDMILVCRKWPPPHSIPSDWQRVYMQIIEETDSLFQRLCAGNKSMPQGDRLVIAAGVWLKHFSQQHQTLCRNGRPLTAEQALSDVLKGVSEPLDMEAETPRPLDQPRLAL